MDSKEVNQVLDELYSVNPNHLNDEAKRLFEAIMKIADERDYWRIKYANKKRCKNYKKRWLY